MRLMRYVAVRIQSLQYSNGMLDWNKSAHATLRRCGCFRSTTKFCRGVSTHKWKETTPLPKKKKSEKDNSGALSLWKFWYPHQIEFESTWKNQEKC